MDLGSVGSEILDSRVAGVCGYPCAALLGVAVALVLVLFMLGAIGTLAFG